MILHKVNDLSKTTMIEFKDRLEALGVEMLAKALLDAPEAERLRLEKELSAQAKQGMGLLVLGMACVSGMAEMGDEGTALLAIMTDLLTDHMETMVILQQQMVSEFANMPTNGTVN